MLTVYTSHHFQPEKEYAFYILFHEILGVPYQVEHQEIAGHIIQLPNGAVLNFEDWFSTFESPGSGDFELKLGRSLLLSSPAPHAAVFQLPGSANLQLPDLFAAAFFMLSRWEEQNPDTERDIHGRFPAARSLAWRLGFLHRPVVNEWADQLWELLRHFGWQMQRKRRRFQVSLSCDVDHPRRWWTKTDRVKTLAGALIRRGSPSEAGYWVRNHILGKKDPFDVFDEWFGYFEKNNIVAQFNFMGERPPASDCWYPHGHPFIQDLMTKITRRGHKTGFHPGYEAFADPDVFKRELDSLQKISPGEITAGRQHYLRFLAPKTWQLWEASGLKEDSTLGYPEAEGFRCGICHDFPVFDTEQRKMLSLREKPLIVMDVTLARYRRYTPEQAFERLTELRRTVEKHGGDFTLLWHNSSWNTPFWEKWKPVFLDFLASAASIE